MRSKSQSATGARPSNAGDEFHFRYTARLALRLLDETSELTFLKVEGLYEGAQGGDEFLGADTVEFYGGRTFADSNKVISSQLKYSSTDPGKSWTVARLCSSSKNSGASVIKRLADDFHDFAQLATLPGVRSKLQIRLVSNQPVDSVLASQIADIQREMQSPGVVSTYAQLKARLNGPLLQLVERLFPETGLGSREFCGFLQVLDFSHCGQPSLVRQMEAFMREAGPFLGDDSGRAIQRLIETVRDLALPGREGMGLDRLNVVAALGAAAEEDLFPAPALFARVESPIPTIDASNLARDLNAHQRILAHGPAGIGKTTTIQLLNSTLPSGSVLLAYDCWGEGACFDFGGTRHTTHLAIRQLINELASKTQLPLLVGSVHHDEDYASRFKRKLQAASEIVPKDALLVVVIDAADNAVIAAKKYGSASFTAGLWTLDLPANCRLVMTARTHRRHLLDPTKEVFDFELSGFDVQASTLHLSRSFVEASPEDGETFHEVTGGVPRWQTYKLDRAREDAKGIHAALDPKLGSLETLFEDLLESTTKHFGDERRGKELVSGLVCMPRPILIAEFAEAHGMSVGDARTFLTGLSPGLVFQSDRASIRDEDFDAFLRSSLTPDELKSAHDRLATHLLRHGLDRAYAARAIAEHLHGAERSDELVDLALTASGLGSIADDILRIQVQRRRFTLGLEATLRKGRAVDAGKLLVLSGMTSKTDHALTQIIRARPDLAATYGDPEAVSNILLHNESEQWYGPTHLFAAALCSRDSARHDQAERHLIEADSWLKLYHAKPKEERQGWRLEAADIAHAAEALYSLYGAKAAYDYVRRWTSIVEIVSLLAEELAGRLSAEGLSEDLGQLRTPGWVDLVFTTAFWKRGKLLSDNILDRATAAALGGDLPQLNRWRDKSFDFVGLAEARASKHLKIDETLALLAKAHPISEDLSERHSFRTEYEDRLRAFCLRAVLEGVPPTVEGLIQEDLPKRTEPSHDHYDQYRNVREALNPLIKVYEFRALGIVGQFPSDLHDQLKEETEGRRNGSGRRYGAVDHTYRDWSIRAYEVLLLDPNREEALLWDIATVALDLYGPAGTDNWIKFADLAAMAGLNALSTKLLTGFLDNLRLRKVPAREKWDLLLDAAAIAQTYDQTLSRDLYLEAVRLAQDVDDDSVLVVSAISRIASRLRKRPPLQDQRKGLALRLARLIEIHEPYVSDRKLLPYREVLSDVAQLWPSGSLSVATHWQEIGLVQEYDSIPILAETLATTGFVKPAAAMGLLRAAGSNYDPTYYGKSILDAEVRRVPNEGARILETMTDRLLRDVDVSERGQSIAKLKDWSSHNDLADSVAGKRLLRVDIFLDGLTPKESTFASDHELERAKKVQAIMDELEGAPVTSIAGLLMRLVEATYKDADIHEFISVAANKVAYAERGALLREFVELPASYRADRYARAVIQLLGLWRSGSGFGITLREELPNIISDFYRRHALMLPFYDESGEEYLFQLAELAGSGFDMHRAIAECVSGSLDKMGPRGLYTMATVLAGSFPDNDISGFVEWMFSQIDEHTKEASDDRVVGAFDPGDQSSSALAGFLWKLMGDRSRAKRWLALHAAREIALAEGAEFIACLAELLDHEDAGPFSQGKEEFLSMSARVMLLVLLRRIAVDSPELIKPYLPLLVEMATDTAFPHAQMRELSKSIVLLPGMLDSVDESIVRKVVLANRPRACLVKRGGSYLRNGRGRMDRETTFSFDWIDTIPYWFNPLDRVFGEPEIDTLNRADRWISETWKRTNDDCKESRASDWNVYEDISNRHGSIPRRETFRHYLEYHAMMCAAGEMCDEGLPIAVGEWEDAVDPWDEWLSAHLPRKGEKWLSELRKPTPLEREFWSSSIRSDWDDSPGVSDYEAAAGLVSQGEYLVLDGDTYRSDYSCSEHVEVSSALVSPEYALSLAASIEGASSHQFHLPSRNDEERGWYQDHKVSPPKGFELIPTHEWLESRETIDGFDALAGGGLTSIPCIDALLCQKLGFRRDEDLEVYLDGEKKQQAWLEWWDDTRKFRYSEEQGTHGKRLWIARRPLLRYLLDAELELVIAVVIRRNSKNDRNTEYNDGTAKAFILRRSGRIEVIRRSCGARSNDHTTTEQTGADGNAQPVDL